ncbi:hypothetical protein WN51_07936 [Melipona quadrifasciata]|uniref:Uncharacterized protein n=1 Tax=Melipona quadrifasciata TaxID=166423 RepID=A0A0M8ZQK8_9HYME|nr:hypothetical protein WN51_07936 [Melipona quadrifasciata]
MTDATAKPPEYNICITKIANSGNFGSSSVDLLCLRKVMSPAINGRPLSPPVRQVNVIDGEIRTAVPVSASATADQHANASFQPPRNISHVTRPVSPLDE